MRLFNTYSSDFGTFLRLKFLTLSTEVGSAEIATLFDLLWSAEGDLLPPLQISSSFSLSLLLLLELLLLVLLREDSSSSLSLELQRYICRFNCLDSGILSDLNFSSSVWSFTISLFFNSSCISRWCMSASR